MGVFFCLSLYFINSIIILFIMEKFLSVPVTGAGTQLIPCSDVKLVEIGDAAGPGSNPTTATTIYYGDAQTLTLTHAAVPANSVEFRTFIQDALAKVLKLEWTEPSLDIVPKFAVSAIAYA